VGVVPFTGHHAESPWWCDTWAVLAKGVSGIVVYGEISALEGLEGRVLKQGEPVGSVVPVLFKDKGNGTTMLHLELWTSDCAIPNGPRSWGLAAPQPEGLMDPTAALLKAWSRVTRRFHREGQKPPVSAKEKQALVNWLQEHPLWTHPETFRAPPGYPNTDVSLFSPETEDWEDYTYQDGDIRELLHVDFAYVDPTTEIPEQDESRNTAFRVWLETGGWYDSAENNPERKEEPDRWDKCHDMDLNCAAATLEDALVELALRVKFFYGENSARLKTVPIYCGGDFDDEGHYMHNCQDGGDGFCKVCGFLLYYEEK